MQQYSPALKAITKKNLESLAFLGEVDIPILPYLRRLNTIPGIVAIYSCWGHPEKFKVSNVLKGDFTSISKAEGYLVLFCNDLMHSFLFDSLQMIIEGFSSNMFLRIQDATCIHSTTNKPCRCIIIDFIGGDEYSPKMLNSLICFLKLCVQWYKKQKNVQPYEKEDWMIKKVYEWRFNR